MFLSLRRSMKFSLNHYTRHPRNEWVVCHPNQIILTVSQIMWAKGVHEILDGSGTAHQKKLEMYEEKCVKVKLFYIPITNIGTCHVYLKDLNNLAALIRTNLPSVTRKILIALITIDVHARDTIQNLVQNKTHDR